MNENPPSFFLPYQVNWILDASRLKILEKSRQIGMTLATAYGAVRRHVTKGNSGDTWTSSRDEFQARLFLDDCKKFSKILAPACDLFGNRFIMEETTNTSAALRFSNGTSINALSSSVDSQAGKRGTRILDEFALHGEQKNLYITALPGITWGGQLEILSTHRGSNNFFNGLICEIREGGNPKKFSHHRVTLEDAIEQGFLEKLKTRLPESDERRRMSDGEYFDFTKNSCPDEESFLQEYMCVPADDRSTFVTSDMVADCEYRFDERDSWELDDFSGETGDCFLGIDIGRSHDLTVFWLLENRNDMLLTRKVLCMQNAAFSAQERELQKFFQIKRLRRTGIDQTGIGRQFSERAGERFGSHRVEGITFTNATKEQLAYQLREVFENRTIRIPSDDFIRSDLRSIKRETTFVGNIRFAGDRGKNGHADRFWALALAIHAANVSKRRTISYFEKIEKRMKRESFV
ncbi:MAG: terminase family protein [Puniceicoccales bacterium]|jgi:phage FluMu gp28-like protein|nr:terminase family protein [Puniceicoccales bacterium]